MKINKYNSIGLLIAVFSFLAYAVPIFTLWWPQWQPDKHLAFNWPDAQANFWAVSQIVDHQSVGYFEILNLPSQNILHTRSQNVIDGVIVPMTFLPLLFIFSSLSWLFGIFSSLFIIPLLAAISLYLLHSLSAKVFANERIGTLTTILLATLGPWYFFASQPLLPNIVIIFLVLLSFYCLVEKKFLAGTLFLALAIVSRPPEIVWLLPLVLLVLYFAKPKISKIRFLNIFILLVAIIVWALYLNKAVFGSYFLSAYSNFQDNSLPSETVVSSTNILTWVFPFGFHPYLALKNFIKYFILLTWPYILLAMLGAWSLFKTKKILARKYFIILSLVGFLLVFYYGSWNLADPLVKNLNHISISYVRYWLPIWVLLIPLAAIGIEYIASRFKLNFFWRIFILLALASFSLAKVYYAKNDGILAQNRVVRAYYQEWQNIKKVAAPDSIIISERSDKYLYPYYRVIVSQGDLPLWSRLEKIIGVVDIYYYGNLDSQFFANTKKEAAINNFSFGFPIGITAENNLYKILNK